VTEFVEGRYGPGRVDEMVDAITKGDCVLLSRVPYGSVLNMFFRTSPGAMRVVSDDRGTE
jgi:hypothetical protein